MPIEYGIVMFWYLLRARLAGRMDDPYRQEAAAVSGYLGVQANLLYQGHENVARPTDRLDDLRVFRIGLDL